MQARYYDPVIGRFYSNDPVGFSNVHNFNRYTYANNNPFKYTDPDGRSPEASMKAGRAFVSSLSPSQRRTAAYVAGGAMLAPVVGLATAGMTVAEVSVMAADVMMGDAIGGASLGGATALTAKSAINSLKLEKQLASESQLSQLAEGGGIVISQPAKQANRIAAQTGADPSKIQKVSSGAHTAKDGSQVQTHSFRNEDTNGLIEPKTIINEE